MNKRVLLILPILCLSFHCFAQKTIIHVGDTVMVNRSTERYLTGERISKWVYKVPHVISQVGSRFFPQGVLLNVAGAKSWLGASDVQLVGTQPAVSPIVVEEKVEVSEPVEEPKVESPVEEKVEQITPVVEEEKVEVAKSVEEPQVVEAPVVAKQQIPVNFQLNGDLLLLGGANNVGVGLELIPGARITDYFFVGAGIELEQLWLGLGEDSRVHGVQFPVFANMKFYLPIKNKYYPHLEISAGANMGKLQNGQSDLGRKSEFYCGVHARAGIGLDINSLSLGVGYQFGNGCSPIEKDFHHAYLKIGFRFLSSK